MSSSVEAQAAPGNHSGYVPGTSGVRLAQVDPRPRAATAGVGVGDRSGSERTSSVDRPRSGARSTSAVSWTETGVGPPRRGLPRTEGHAAGEAALMDAVEGGLDLGIRWLTVYAFSTENWRRPADEVRFLMGFNESLLTRRRDELHEKGVRIRFAGRAGLEGAAAGC